MKQPRNFNSIKVQLRPSRPGRGMRPLVPSQFHKGTIKTATLPSSERLISHFNSIKVQLRPETKNKIACIITFQFHKGTIKTSANGSYTRPCDNFNSIKVQLRLAVALFRIGLIRISIP